MQRFSKILILFFLETSSFILFAQDADTLRSKDTIELNDSLPPDTTAKINQPVIDKFTPDTVFLINGDKITGNIVSYSDGRLKMDAQGAGIINIKWQKIFSISGGSRQFKIEDLRKEIYMGPIQFSKDTGEIIIVNKLRYGILFSDMLSLFPIVKAGDSLLSAQAEIEKNKPVVYKHSPDTVFLKSRDKITGKIISFEQGRLKIDAQSAGIIYIKWHKIASIKGGSRQFKVEDRIGEIYIGHIEISKDTGEIDVVNKLRYGIFLEDIVRIFPLEEEWYRGFKGNMGAGLNYTKSSGVLNINADYNLYYVVSKWRFINDFSFIETTTDKEDKSLRLQVELQALYALPHKWVLSEISSYNRNDELGIDSRISFNVGAGNSIVQTEKQRLLVLTGVVQNSEKDIESNNVTSSFEWPFSIQHSIYSFIAPNITSTTKGTSFVGITEKGRYRIDASTDVTWEFVASVKFKLSFYYSFDNKVVEGKTSQEDYGTVLSLTFDLK